MIDLGYECEEDDKKRSICTYVGFTSVCGNSKLQGSEECDNGDAIGCRNCVVDTGYSCQNFVYGQSICSEIRCGNQIRETGQQCDNG